MTRTCKWITDEAGPLVCRKGEFSYSWSICASAAECSGAMSAPIKLSTHMRWPQTKTMALAGSSAAAMR